MKQLRILFKGGLPKSIIEIKADNSHRIINAWYDNYRDIEVPMKDWEDGKVTIMDIHRYL